MEGWCFAKDKCTTLHAEPDFVMSLDWLQDEERVSVAEGVHVNKKLITTSFL